MLCLASDLTEMSATNCMESQLPKMALDIATYYHRDWLIGACAYHLQQQENLY